MVEIAERVKHIEPSVFAEINALAREHNAVNLSQGAPDYDTSPELVRWAVEALQAGTMNQYAQWHGRPSLREAVAAHAQRWYGQAVDPDRDVLIVGGASLGVFFVIMGVVNPGDEVVVLEPFFDTYVPGVEMAGGVPRYVPLRPPDWTFDPDELRAAFNNKTKAIIINTPHNPTSRVFTREELTLVADLCQQWDAVAITDEVYEHLIFDGGEHLRLATLPGMAGRAITVSSMGKTFNATGWKLGWCIGPAELLQGPKQVHAYSMFAMHHPMQEAAAQALHLPDTFFLALRATFQAKRDQLVKMLSGAGLQPSPSQGGYYVMANYSAVFEGDEIAFAKYMARDVGVACIPPRVFFSKPHRHLARNYARFTFCKNDETLAAAEARLERLKG